MCGLWSWTIMHVWYVGFTFKFLISILILHMYKNGRIFDNDGCWFLQGIPDMHIIHYNFFIHAHAGFSKCNLYCFMACMYIFLFCSACMVIYLCLHKLKQSLISAWKFIRVNLKSSNINSVKSKLLVYSFSSC